MKQRKLATPLSPYRTYVGLGLIWLVMTLINIKKAFHIDDTAYLEISKWIQTNPLHPMSGQINWGGVAEPIYTVSQPHLFFYFTALWMSLFGDSEIALHSLMALFCLGCILIFFNLAKNLVPKTPLILTAILFLSPGFIPSQNMMVEVPLLFFCLLFFQALFFSLQNGRATLRWLVVAGLSSGFAALVKYTSLITIPILGIVLLLRRRFKHFWVIFIPILILVMWSVFNYFDYGGIHGLGRYSVTGGSYLRRISQRADVLILCFGAVCPFFLLIHEGIFRSRNRFRIITVICLFLGFLEGRNVYRDDSLLNSLIGTFAVFNGTLLMAAILFLSVQGFRKKSPEVLLLSLWIFSFLGFVSLFAPFIAVRHILVTIPPILLLVGQTIDWKKYRTRARITLALTATLGVLLGVSDWKAADANRVQSRVIREFAGKDKIIYFTGHWGWQWYAKKEGMIQYEINKTVLHEGDFLVEPLNVARAPIRPEDKIRLRFVRSFTTPSEPLTTLSTMTGFYSTKMKNLPWSISTEPLAKFDVYETVTPAD